MHTNTEIKNIINKQQEYEYLRKTCIDNKANSTELYKELNTLINTELHTDYAQKIALTLCKQLKREKLQQQISMIFKIVLFVILLIALFTSAAAIYSTIRNKSNPTHITAIKNDPNAIMESMFDSAPVGQAKTAIESKDYDTAKKILDGELQKHPDGFGLFMSYVDLYESQQMYDEAANTLIDFLTNHEGTQNIISTNNYAYAELKNFSYPITEDTSAQRTQCLTACESSIERFRAMDTLIAQGNYDYVLSMCDESKANGGYDYALYSYYYQSYTNLQRYDDCATYFLSLIDKSDEKPLAYPDNLTIANCLQQIYNNTSATIKEQINDSGQIQK